MAAIPSRTARCGSSSSSADGHRAEHVLDVEVAAQPDVQRQRPARRLRDQRDRASLAHLDRGRPHVGLVARRGVRQHRPRGLCRQPPAVGVAQVDGAGPRRVLEQPPLGQVVRLHVRVEVEVVLRQVRERDSGEAQAVDAPQLERVRRHLHRAAAVAGVGHPPQDRLQVDALRRRAGDRLDNAADARLDRAQQPGPQPGRRQDRVQQVGGRRLAVGAGDADHLQLVAGTAVEGVGRGRHRLPRRLDHELRDRQVEHALDDQRDGAVLDCRPPRSRGRRRAGRGRRRGARPAPRIARRRSPR